jgi:hypothetical protein
MDENRMLDALIEGAITYAVYLLMTTPASDLKLAKSRVYRRIAGASQSIATWFGRVGMNAERKSQECLS